MKERIFNICFYTFWSVVIIALTYTTFQRNKVYADDVVMWTDVINKAPENRRAYDERSVVYVRKQKYELALADANRVMGSGRIDARIFCNRGAIFLNLKKSKQAIVDFNHALRLDPNYYQAYHNRAIGWYYLKEYDRAIADFEKAARLNPVFAARKGAGNLLNTCRRLAAKETKTR